MENTGIQLTHEYNSIHQLSTTFIMILIVTFITELEGNIQDIIEILEISMILPYFQKKIEKFYIYKLIYKLIGF